MAGSTYIAIKARASSVTLGGLRQAAGNAALALTFIVAAVPSAVNYRSGLANWIWIIGAAMMGAFSLIRVPPRAVMVDWRALASTAGMLVLPLMMRPTHPSLGVIGELAVALELAGVTISQVARLYMGTRFGVLPANRGIVSRGPFGIVRHPVYFGWLILFFGYALSYQSVRNCLMALLTVPFMLWRVDLEEELLVNDPEYRAYRERVHYRLLPGIY